MNTKEKKYEEKQLNIESQYVQYTFIREEFQADLRAN